MMARVRGVHTGPEIVVRRLLYSLGYRYRLYAGELPGRPDIVFRSRRKVIFVNGCFWHRHSCRRGRPPKSNRKFWVPKLRNNRRRDLLNLRKLKKLGWSTLVIWECGLKKPERVERELRKYLANSN
jgi:DNA mismatch endonuclease, patch repair protein